MGRLCRPLEFLHFGGPVWNTGRVKCLILLVAGGSAAPSCRDLGPCRWVIALLDAGTLVRQRSWHSRQAAKLALSSASEAGTLVSQRSWHSRQPAKLAGECGPGWSGFCETLGTQGEKESPRSGRKAVCGWLFLSPASRACCFNDIPRVSQRRFTLGHTLPPASRVEDVETPGASLAGPGRP